MPLDQQDIDYFMNECEIELTGASQAGIKQAMWGVIKEFLADTESWIEYQKLLVTAGLQTYTITPRDQGQVVRLVGVLDGNRIPAAATMQDLGVLKIRDPITVSSIDTVVDPAATTATNPWTVCIVKNIQLPATRDVFPIAPKFVLQVYQEAIKAGVCGRMMLQPGKAHSNPALAQYHLKRFRDQIGIARTQTWNQNLQGGQRWQFPQGFATHTQRGYTSTSQPWPQETI